MKFLCFFVVLIFISVTNALSFDVTLLRNNKESYSRIVTKKDRANLRKWSEQHRLGEELKTQAAGVFRGTMLEYTKRETYCDVGLVNLLLQKALFAAVIEEVPDSSPRR